MKIYAASEINLTDYPGEITCTVYTQGCNLKCEWCHNKSLWDHIPGKLDIMDVINGFGRVKPTAFAFSGGEPMEHKAQVLEDARDLRKLGYKVILYTNGLLLDRDCLGAFNKIVISVKGGQEFYGQHQLIKLFNAIIFMSSVGVDFDVQILRSIHGEETEKLSGPFRKFARVVN